MKSVGPATPRPDTEAGRDYAAFWKVREALIEAVQSADAVGALKAFAAYDDFLEAEARQQGAAAERERLRALASEAFASDGIAAAEKVWPKGVAFVAGLAIDATPAAGASE